MTTGYTSDVEDGKIGFEEFVWNCTRAFGVFLHMRDESHGTKLRVSEPDNYYKERVETATKDLTTILARTDKEWAAEFKKDDELREKSNAESRAKNLKTRKNLTKVLQQVYNWVAGPDHEELKKFMVQQLTSSLDYCKDYDSPKNEQTFQKRVEDEVEWAVSNAKRAREDYAKQLRRSEEAQVWVDSLRAQIPVPRHLDGFTPNKKA